MATGRLVCLTALLLAACGRAPEPGSQPVDETGGPNVGLTRVAGVAMSYGFRFLVPAQKVQALQERHAAACEALGPARCRVVGMGYHVDQQRRIDATLSLKLHPDLARRFGRQGVVAATEMGGMLTDATATSEEAGAALAAARADAAKQRGEQAAARSQVDGQGTSAAERAALREQAAASAGRARLARAAAAEAAGKLAATPIEFGYVSGTVDPGFTDGPVLGAIKDGWSNIVAGVATLLMIVITVLPWLVAAYLIALLWRRAIEPFLARTLRGRRGGD